MAIRIDDGDAVGMAMAFSVLARGDIHRSMRERVGTGMSQRGVRSSI